MAIVKTHPANSASRIIRAGGISSDSPDSPIPFVPAYDLLAASEEQEQVALIAATLVNMIDSPKREIYQHSIWGVHARCLAIDQRF
ncbi:MAG: hypothetical protein KDD53_09410 [Bdellovibrionales bacterium]|nr:hypothetical protein [Bdellovibrionales bacterium]